MVTPLKRNSCRWRIWAVIIALMFSNTGTTEVTGQERILHFPKDRSIGEVFIRDQDIFAENYYAWTNWEWLGYARGDVTVPAGKAVKLDITKEAWQGDKFFSGLRPDDIQMLSFDKYKEADDAVLEDISSLTNLQLLDLSGTQILGTGLEHLGKLKQLKWIGLAATDFGDKELAFLTELPSLEYLNFNNVPIGDQG